MRVLVTGGGGFLGRAIVRQLRAQGDEPCILGRGPQPELAAEGVRVFRGDIADYPAVREALAGCEAVIHSAAMVGSWGRARCFRRTNVTGTRNVIEACRAQDVRKLVFTSTPSVVHAGEDASGLNESAPYSGTFDAHYPRTKAIAERLVLAANDERLSTVALRPHLVFGPGDTQLLPRAVASARAGRLRLPGGPSKLVDWTYVDDAARAHLLALQRLAPGSPCAGKAYFISQGQPVPLRELITRAVAAAGGPMLPKRQVPPGLLFAAGCLSEAAFFALRIYDREPPITRFVARQLTTAHWFDITAARRDLGFIPQTTLEQALLSVATV
ncbi:MAG TPA: NAD-dependent epimerase/dehydratase family protein [Myxococcales bacterium]|nr:NAD-dependent epimerase/dehydratase family protein [Myxococcales bacterium]